jgi:cytochrome b561
LRAATEFTHTAIALHWIAAILIIGNLAFGLYMVGLPLTPAKLKYYSWHKWAGVSILLLSTVRLVWRLAHRAPALPSSMPAWQRSGADASHHFFYLLFFAAPLTGWLFSSAEGFQTVYFGMIPLPDLFSKDKELADILRIVHRLINYTLAALVVLHAAAAIKHHVVDRDEVLTRMLPLFKPRT